MIQQIIVLLGAVVSLLQGVSTNLHNLEQRLTKLEKPAVTRNLGAGLTILPSNLNNTVPTLSSGSVVFSDGTALTEDNSNFFYDNTNNRLGIGTTSPAVALSVQGNALVSGTTTVNGLVATSSVFLATSVGNVGVGSTSPGEKFAVQGDSLMRGFISFDTTSFSAMQGNRGGIRNLSDNGLTLMANNDSTVRDFTLMDPDGNFRYLEVTNAGHIVAQGSPESGGNFGVGTTTPTSLVSIETNNATSTIYLAATNDRRAGCIQLEGPASTTYRLYINGDGPALRVEAGSCNSN